MHKTNIMDTQNIDWKNIGLGYLNIEMKFIIQFLFPLVKMLNCYNS